MTSRDAVEEGEREESEKRAAVRDIMRHSEPAIAIKPSPLPPSEWLFQPTADNKPTLGLHAHMHG